MTEKFRKTTPSPYVGLLVFLLIIFGSSALASGLDRNAEGKSEIFKSALVKDKGDYGVGIDGRQYRVTESTVILDPLGKKIPLCDLPTPCVALVEFQLIEGQNPVSLRIEVKRLLDDSKDSS